MRCGLGKNIEIPSGDGGVPLLPCSLATLLSLALFLWGLPLGGGAPGWGGGPTIFVCFFIRIINYNMAMAISYNYYYNEMVIML